MLRPLSLALVASLGFCLASDVRVASAQKSMSAPVPQRPGA
jgi:hypothetical protein